MDAPGSSLRLELFVEDMDAAIAFYTQVLGFELVRRKSGYASVRHGGTRSRIRATVGEYFTRGIAERRSGLGVEIVLEVNDLEAVHESVSASGHPILEPPQNRVADPDGYYLRLTSRS